MKFTNIATLVLSSDISNKLAAQICGIYRGSVPKYRKRLTDAGVSRQTVANYSENELQKIINPSRKTVSNLNFDEPEWSKIIPEINAKSGACAALFYDEYCKGADNPMSPATFYRRLSERNKALGPVMRIHRVPAQEVFVDFSGKRPEITDPESGRKEKVELFVACLGRSKLAFACAVRSQRIEDWIKANVAMFSYFGGVSKYVVPDNLKSAVTIARKSKAGVHLNPQYMRMLAHYGCTALPARSGAPQDKGMVESSVLHLKRWIIYPLSRQIYTSLDEINQEISVLLERINNKPMRRMANLSRREIFEQQERSHLRKLPETPYQYARHRGHKIVPEDYHLNIDGAFYSVPHRLTGERIEIFETDSSFSFFHNITRVAVHPKARAIGDVVTEIAHVPSRYRKYAQHRERHFVTWGDMQSAPVRKYLQAHLNCWKNPNATEKASMRLQKLSDFHGRTRVSAAAERILAGLDEGDSPASQKLSVRRIELLVKHPRDLKAEHDPFGNDGVIEHENIRGSEYYE